MKSFDAVKSGTQQSKLPFSQAVVVSGLVIVSGQASVSPSGDIIHGTFEEEMRRSMENLTRVLKAAGCSLDSVFQTRNYVAEDSDLAEFNSIYREYFSEPYPARTTLTKCLGAGLKFEIDAMAVMTGSSAA